jgi:hypothetical protein
LEKISFVPGEKVTVTSEFHNEESKSLRKVIFALYMQCSTGLHAHGSALLMLRQQPAVTARGQHGHCCFPHHQGGQHFDAATLVVCEQ